VPKEVNCLALPMITDLKQVPLGPIVRDFVIGYDSEPEQHVGLVIDILWESPHGLHFESYEETVVYCRERRLLREYPSSVWKREEACAYAEYLALAVGQLRGQAERPLITTNLAFDLHRGEWLKSEELRTAVTELQSVLDRALIWFNIKMVAMWFTWIDSYRVEWPEILKELKPEDVRQQANQLDDLCYMQGRAIVAGHCGDAWQRIANLEEVPRSTRNLFLMTTRQLHEATRLRVGADPKDADLTVLDEVALEEPELLPEPQERRTTGGIYLP
jgi:hypothetical protein